MPSQRQFNKALDALRRARLVEVEERIKRLKRENAWGENQMVLRTDFDAFLSRLFTKQRAILYGKAEGEIPAQVAGLGALEIRRALRGMADEICDAMQEMLKGFEFKRPPRLPDHKKKTPHHDEEKD